MGTMDLERFRANLLFDLKNRTDTATSTGLDNQRLDEWINAGYLHVTHPTVFRHRELQYRFNLTLLTGINAYTFTPTPEIVAVNITAIRSVAHVDAATDDPLAFRTKVYPKDEQWFQERTLVQTGPPRNYFVRGSSLVVGPVPSANENGQVLAVTAWREPALLTAGQVTVLSTLWDEIVLLAARWRAELHLGYRDLAEATKLDFTGLVNEYQDFETLHGEDWDWSSGLRMDRTMEMA